MFTTCRRPDDPDLQAEDRSPGIASAARMGEPLHAWSDPPRRESRAKAWDQIEPSYNSDYGKGKNAGFVYLTATLGVAAWGAELALGQGPRRIYVVEATGQYEDSPNLTNKKYPNNPAKSYRSRRRPQVTGEVTD
jgi:Rifampin ADP-ribosyl transferase